MHPHSRQIHTKIERKGQEMKSRLFTLAALVAAACAFSLVHVVATSAQSTAGVPNKIGIVDLQKVMDAYNKREAEVSKLEEEVERSRSEIERLRNAFQDEVEGFSEVRGTLSEEERFAREAKLDRKALNIETTIQLAESSLARQQRRLKKLLLDDIIEAVSAIADEENYHLILEADPETRTGVLYHATALEITSDVITRLNR
jgi:Skp family chaperone for outer membrane proteins